MDKDNSITRVCADQGRTIRVPIHMIENINKLTRIQSQLVQELGREPTPKEIAEQMDMEVDKVIDMIRILKAPYPRNPYRERRRQPTRGLY